MSGKKDLLPHERWPANGHRAGRHRNPSARNKIKMRQMARAIRAAPEGPQRRVLNGSSKLQRAPTVSS
eukprot:14888180-Alexandrium_andersonii.AAC.1